MEDSAPLPVVDHRVEGGGGHGQQGGDEAVLAQQPQTPRSASSSGSTPFHADCGRLVPLLRRYGNFAAAQTDVVIGVAPSA